MSRGQGAGPTQRQLRVAEQIRHILAEALLRGEVRDPRLADANITIAEVRISRDLRQATVYATELGRPLRPEIRAVLERAAPFLAGMVARAMNLKYAPRLQFVADELFDEAARMERLFAAARAVIGPAAAGNGEDGTWDGSEQT
jgi:ribosome-binding factor A